MAAAADDYATRGWRVFPLHNVDQDGCSCRHEDCASPAKHPRTERGFKDATADVNQVQRWWQRWPAANIGLVTGEAFDVLDVDGEEGRDELEYQIERHDDFPEDQPVSVTGNGWHFLFSPSGIGNKAGLLPKVDWRGRGGYIVAPPSQHINGNTYNWYRPCDTPLPAVPDWLMQLLNPPKVERPPAKVSFLPAQSGQGSLYGLAALEAEVGELARAQPGTRNNTLNACAFNLYQLVAARELDERLVEDRLTGTARAIGLAEREITATIASARTAGIQQPRSAPPSRLAANGSLAPAAAIEPVAPPNVDEEPRPSKYDFELVVFLNQPEPDYDWVIPGLIERGDRVILTGPEGGGKSTLLRQFTVMPAAGLHPFTIDDIPPVRTLLIDLENGTRHLRRQLRPLWLNARHRIEEGVCRVISLPSGIDLLAATHVEWLEQRFAADKPELVVIGPIYKMANGDPTEERVAKAAATVLDTLRTRYSCAFIIEAHQPYSNGGARRPERPYGASLWSRWPEFGLHLSESGELRHWRGDRDERHWPAALKRGGEWPWTVEASVRGATFARIIEEINLAGQKLSYRQLADRLKTDKSQIQRAIDANKKQYEQHVADLSW